MSRIFTVLAFIAILVAPVTAQEVEVGYASWYNKGFHGLTTASGEAYDHEAMTAAHPTLPFGSMIRITRTDDGRSIQVRVNDRMESGPGHVIDLSGGAARQLGLMDTGVARVRIGEGAAIVTTPATTTSPVVPASTGYVSSTASYTLQLGVFSIRASAQQLAADHDGAWIQTMTDVAGKSIYRVYFKSFEGESTARTAQRSLSDRGLDSFLRHLQ
ncbi:MAG: rare lipoprotein A [Rhodothermales bacterium]|jgi:rare lipoprotein A